VSTPTMVAWRPAERLDGGAREFVGDPVRSVGSLLSRRRRDACVESHRDLHEDEWALMLDPAGEAFVEAAGFRLAGADGDFDSCGAEGVEAVAGDGGVGIDGGGDNAAEAGFDKRIGTGRSAAGDVAGLEGDVGGAAVNAIARMSCGLAEGDDFGVVKEIVLVPALADDLAGPVENDAADSGIRRGDTDAAARELEGAAHQWRSRSGGAFMCGREEQSSVHGWGRRG